MTKEVKNWSEIFTIHVIKGLRKDYIKNIAGTSSNNKNINNPKGSLGKRCEKVFYKRNRHCQRTEDEKFPSLLSREIHMKATMKYHVTYSQ